MNLYKGKNVTFVNPYSYLILRNIHNDYISSNKFIVLLDGFILVWILRILGKKSINRISFDDSSLAPAVFEDAQKNNLKIGLIGSSPGIVDKAKLLLLERYPDLNILYTQNGFFLKEENNNIVANSMQCDVVICSMGTPKQEDFLIKLREEGWLGTGYTCGGYLDQLVSAKGSSYYPEFIDKFNLRWLYRIYKEPRRLLLRYLLDYPRGIFFFIFDYFFKNMKNKF